MHMQEQAEQVEAECRSELESVEVQIAELDAQLALGDIAAGGGAAAGGTRAAQGCLTLVPALTSGRLQDA